LHASWFRLPQTSARNGLVMLRIELPAAQAANITVRPHSQVTAVHSTRRLETLIIRGSNTGTAETLPTAALFILCGAPTPPPLARQRSRARRPRLL
jgi:hypothetical protein